MTISGGSINAVSSENIGIFTRSTLTVTGGAIHAKGGPGLAAVAARVVRGDTADAATAKIAFSNVIEKNDGKVMFAEWFEHVASGETRSWTGFIADADDALTVRDDGNMVNALNEVWLGTPRTVSFNVSGGRARRSAPRAHLCL